ncbi:MAG: prolipoprotein diacylglyceryl transferase family protein [Planctomycetota bacterium]
MHPVLFEIFGLPLRSFGLMVVLGFLLGSHLFAKLGHKYALDQRREAPGFQAVPLWILAGIMLGARAMYVIVEILRGSPAGQQYLADPFTMLAYWEGGLVMYGGTFGGIALGLWAARKHRLRLWHALDLGMTTGFFGLAVGRVGCLLVGDDYGSIVPESAEGLPFPLTITVPDPLPAESLFGEQNRGQVLWATQPWMSANAVLLGAIGTWLIPRRRFAGFVTLVLLTLYSVGRFVIEMYRGDEIRGMWFDGAISTSQLVSIVLGSVSVVLLIALRNRREAPPVAWAPQGDEGSDVKGGIADDGSTAQTGDE